METESWLKESKNGVTLEVRVTPNSAKNAFTRNHAGRLGIKLTSPPQEGRANKSLLAFLGKKLRIPPSSMTIISGRSSRNKVVMISNTNIETIRERLAQVVQEFR